MVQVNKLRKTIGRLQVKVSLSIHSSPPWGWGGEGSETEPEEVERTRNRPKLIKMAEEYESWVYHLLCGSLRTSGIMWRL